MYQKQISGILGMFEREILGTTKRGNCCPNDKASQSEYVNFEQLRSDKSRT